MGDYSVEIVVREKGNEIYRCTTTIDKNSSDSEVLKAAFWEALRNLKLPRNALNQS